MRPSCVAALLVGSALLLLQAPTSAGDVATADALFRKGVADMEAGRFDAACPAIAESNRLDPRPGTLFTLANCEAKAGKIATAVALFDDYLLAFSRMTPEVQQKHLDRSKIARAQKEALTPDIPELTLTLSASSPPNVRVMRDGFELTRASLGIALPLDPGDHVVTTQAPGGQIIEKRFTLARKEKKVLELDAAQAPAPGPTAAAVPTATLEGPGAGQPSAPPEAPGDGSGRRTAAYIVGAVGLAGLAVGGITGGLAIAKKSIIDENCVERRCNAEGKEAGDSAFPMSIASTVGFGVGIAGIGAGLALLLTAPSAAKSGSAQRGVRAHVLGAGPDGGILGVRGAF